MAPSDLARERQILELLSTDHHIGVFDLDLVEETLYLDENARAMLAFTTEDPKQLYEEWNAAIHPDDLGPIQDVVAAHTRGDTPAYTVEYRMTHRRDGSTRWFLARGMAVRGDDGTPVRLVGVRFDITAQKDMEEERRLLEAKIHQSQRLESLGVLAGGVAHDFNNLLMAILGNAGLARRAVEKGSVADDKISQVETAARRAADLTSQMLAFSGRGAVDPSRIDLSSVVQETAQLLRSVISKKAQLHLTSSADPVFVDADTTQLRQVVMNLITNASDALGEIAGEINVVTGQRRFDAPFLAQLDSEETLLEGEYVFIQVEDSGSGMEERTRRRVFEPFFSTKFTGRGLGLSATLGILRAHEGGIRIQSTPGAGTKVTVLLPPAKG